MSTLIAGSLKGLQAAALRCGLSSSGTKAELAASIKQFYESTKSIKEIISIDMGTKNLALSHMTRDLEVRSLKLIDLELPDKFDPQAFVQATQRFIQQSLEPNLIGTHDGLKILIERQRCRTMGSRAIPESILRVNFVEILLHYRLMGKAIAMSPERVARYFDLPKGSAKKAASVTLITGMIANGRIKVPSASFNIFESSRKKDDLSDSLLQAVAFFEWQRNSSELHDCLTL